MKKLKFFHEFKEFISRGNVIDMAIGVVVGGAFKSVVDALVNCIIMPVVGWIIGGIDFSAFAYTLPPIFGRVVSASSIMYGAFINNVISFLVIAFVLFCVVKFINALRRKKEAPQEEKVPEPTEEEKLLAEIRDLLKAQNENKE